MRNPARIDRILEKLRILWSAAPDMRLMQLLSNTGAIQHSKDGEELRVVDPFYTEDDVIECQLDETIDEWRGNI